MLMGRRLSLCLLLHLRPLAGFAPTAVVYRDPGNTLADIQRTKGAINRIWDLPQSIVSTAGLGSGITYAWDPELCANMLPTFREDLDGIRGVAVASKPLGNEFMAVPTALALSDDLDELIEGKGHP